ncbi:MAG TPA: glucose-1-phosphate adenylyltransferase [Nevskiaceae bacterium]|nr:glucose-1-phosphate adenylyltransferase [Nevskiaceae bacterium]
MSPVSESRHISRLTRETLALVLAGGRGSRLGALTDWRAKPAVPFGGKFRVIDFTMSNCVNSGVKRIGVLTQYKSHSLMRHIQQGWGFLRAEVGEFVELLAAQQRISETAWYAGTADAVYQNLDIIRHHSPKYVLVLAGDHIYKMDYGPMLAEHVARGAAITVGCVEVPLDQARGFGVMTVNAEGRVVKFLEKPAKPEPMPGRTDVALASMGIYVFNAQWLRRALALDAKDPDSQHDFGKNIIPGAIEREVVIAHPFRDVQNHVQPYWRDVGTVDAYWEANIELTAPSPALNLYDREWPIWTYQEQLPPAKFVFDEPDRKGYALDSLVSGGCIVSGARLKRSLLFSNVVVESLSSVEESVILPDVRIGRGCKLQRTVIDKGCILPDGTTIGIDRGSDAQRFHVTPGGVVLVTPDMLGQSLHAGE